MTAIETAAREDTSGAAPAATLATTLATTRATDVRSAADIVASHVGRYGLLLDQPDIAGWVALFDEDTWYRLVTRDQLDRGYELFVLNERKARLNDRIHWIEKLWQLQEPTYWRHIYSNPVVEEWNAERIVATVPFVLYSSTPERPPRVDLTGHYRTELVLVDGRWLFRDHLVVVDTGVLPNALALPI